MKPAVYANWLMMNYKWKLCVLSSFFSVIISKHYISFSLSPNIFHLFSFPWSLNISLQSCFSFHLFKKKKKKTSKINNNKALWRSDNPSSYLSILFIYSSTYSFTSFTHSDHLILQFSRFILSLSLKTLPSWQQFWCENLFWVFWHSKWFVL